MTPVAIPSVTDRVAADRSAGRPRRIRALRRLRLWLLTWPRRRSELLGSDRLRADPGLRRDLGLAPLPPDHFERWVTATLNHRR